MMLTSKIINQTTENLFQFDLDKSYVTYEKDTLPPLSLVHKVKKNELVIYCQTCFSAGKGRGQQPWEDLKYLTVNSNMR